MNTMLYFTEQWAKTVRTFTLFNTSVPYCRTSSKNRRVLRPAQRYLFCVRITTVEIISECKNCEIGAIYVKTQEVIVIVIYRYPWNTSHHVPTTYHRYAQTYLGSKVLL